MCLTKYCESYELHNFFAFVSIYDLVQCMLKKYINFILNRPNEIEFVFDLHSDHFYGNLQARIVENMD